MVLGRILNVQGRFGFCVSHCILHLKKGAESGQIVPYKTCRPISVALLEQIFILWEGHNRLYLAVEPHRLMKPSESSMFGRGHSPLYPAVEPRLCGFEA